MFISHIYSSPLGKQFRTCLCETGNRRLYRKTANILHGRICRPCVRIGKVGYVSGLTVKQVRQRKTGEDFPSLLCRACVRAASADSGTHSFSTVEP